MNIYDKITIDKELFISYYTKKYPENIRLLSDLKVWLEYWIKNDNYGIIQQIDDSRVQIIIPRTNGDTYMTLEKDYCIPYIENKSFIRLNKHV